MADDDDTSAGLTPGSGHPKRRKASRVAGPPSALPAGAAPTPTPVVTMEKSPAPEPTGTATAVTIAAPVPEPGEPSAVAAAAAAETGPVASDRGGRGSLGWIVALVLALVLVAAAVWLVFERNAALERDTQRNAFVQTARQTVLNLTTIKPDTAKDDVDRILAGASGEFKSEFDGREDPFVSVVKQAGVTTVGKIIESGFESQDGDTARVLVAARADVSTPDGSENGPRDFRMRVTVTDNDGTMTASKVEFVP